MNPLQKGKNTFSSFFSLMSISAAAEINEDRERRTNIQYKISCLFGQIFKINVQMQRNSAFEGRNRSLRPQ